MNNLACIMTLVIKTFGWREKYKQIIKVNDDFNCTHFMCESKIIILCENKINIYDI